jgi:putative heme-binding domain-containing protein
VPLVRRFIARRAVDDAAARADKGDLAPLVAALTTAGELVAADLLEGARTSLLGRKSMKMPDGWPAAYAKLRRSTDPKIREHAVVLALIFGDPQAVVDLRKVVQTPGEKPAERVAALEALVQHRAPDLAPLLHELLADRDLRRTALRGLASYSHEATPKLVLARYGELTADEKQDAVATLASRKDYALVLLDAVEKKAVPRGDVSAYIARQLYSLGDKRVTERVREVWGDVRDSSPEKQQQMARYKAILTPGALKNANPQNGRVVFNKTCQQCHKLFGEGGTIGPDLTGANRSDLDYLLFNVIDPSAEVAQDYRMSLVYLQSGRVVTGIIVERSPVRLIVQTATERLALSREDVDTIKDSPLSIMPEKQLDGLTKEQIRDLFAYLASKTQVPLPAASKEK